MTFVHRNDSALRLNVHVQPLAHQGRREPIRILVLLGLFWSCFGENTPDRTPPAVRTSGTIRL